MDGLVGSCGDDLGWREEFGGVDGAFVPGAVGGYDLLAGVPDSETTVEGA